MSGSVKERQRNHQRQNGRVRAATSAGRQPAWARNRAFQLFREALRRRHRMGNSRRCARSDGRTIGGTAALVGSAETPTRAPPSAISPGAPPTGPAGAAARSAARPGTPSTTGRDQLDRGSPRPGSRARPARHRPGLIASGTSRHAAAGTSVDARSAKISGIRGFPGLEQARACRKWRRQNAQTRSAPRSASFTAAQLGAARQQRKQCGLARVRSLASWGVARATGGGAREPAGGVGRSSNGLKARVDVPSQTVCARCVGGLIGQQAAGRAASARPRPGRPTVFSCR